MQLDQAFISASIKLLQLINSAIYIIIANTSDWCDYATLYRTVNIWQLLIHILYWNIVALLICTFFSLIRDWFKIPQEDRQSISDKPVCNTQRLLDVQVLSISQSDLINFFKWRYYMYFQGLSVR